MQCHKSGLLQNKKVYLFAFIIPAIAIILRVLYRLNYYSGWETIGAANGLFLLKNYSLFETVKEMFWLSRHYYYWTSTNSILFSLFPGLMSSVLPWEFWPHFHVFIVFAFSLWLCGISLQIKRGQWAWLALALASSPALLSFSIVGYPYISVCLPHAMALLVIFHPRFKKEWWLALLVGILTIEVSWHAYELGKTIFILFFLAAFFQEKTRLKNRVVYFLLGVISIGLIYFTDSKGGVVVNLLNAISMTSYSALFSQLGKALKTIFWNPGLDLPILPVLGLLGLFFLKKGRWIFVGILLAQWILILMLSFEGLYAFKSRRFLLVEFYNIVVLLAVVKQWSGCIDKKRWVKFGSYALLIILISGSVWQFIDLGKYTSVAVHKRHHSLPYTSSADYNVQPQYIAAANHLYDMINQGKRIILIYNYHTYQENTTDPGGMLERLYLKLGHEKFKDNILIFSDKFERYSSVPIIPITEVHATLNDLQVMQYNGKGGNLLNEYFVIRHPDGVSKPFMLEADLIMKALQDNFNLIKLKNEIPPFSVYKVFPLHYSFQEPPFL